MRLHATVTLKSANEVLGGDIKLSRRSSLSLRRVGSRVQIRLRVHTYPLTKNNQIISHDALLLEVANDALKGNARLNRKSNLSPWKVKPRMQVWPPFQPHPPTESNPLSLSTKIALRHTSQIPARSARLQPNRKVKRTLSSSLGSPRNHPTKSYKMKTMKRLCHLTEGHRKGLEDDKIQMSHPLRQTHRHPNGLGHRRPRTILVT